jgi:hypothetical protein
MKLEVKVDGRNKAEFRNKVAKFDYSGSRDNCLHSNVTASLVYLVIPISYLGWRRRTSYILVRVDQGHVVREVGLVVLSNRVELLSWVEYKELLSTKEILLVI